MSCYLLTTLTRLLGIPSFQQHVNCSLDKMVVCDAWSVKSERGNRRSIEIVQYYDTYSKDSKYLSTLQQCTEKMLLYWHKKSFIFVNVTYSDRDGWRYSTALYHYIAITEVVFTLCKCTIPITKHSDGILWNSINVDIKNTDNVNVFKRIIRNWQGPICQCGECLICIFKVS